MISITQSAEYNSKNISRGMDRDCIPNAIHLPTQQINIFDRVAARCDY